MLYCDNQSSLKSARNALSHARSKHVEVWQHFIRENVLIGIVNLVYIASNDQLADLLTKALGRLKSLKHCNGIGIKTAL